MKLKMKYSFYFYFYFLLRFFVNCQNCDGCKVISNICTHDNEYHKICDPNCRPDLLSNPPTCYYCKDIEPGNKYFIDQQNGKCLIGNEIIYCTYIVFNSNQCAKQCSGLNSYKMGSFCYPDCVQENRLKSNKNTCKCKNYYFILTVEKKNLWQCYNENEKCQSSHQSYNLNSKLCSTSSKCSNLIKYEQREGKSNIIRCSTKCIGDEKLYNNKRCVDVCPPEAPYFYEKESIKYCTDDCQKENLYIDIQTNECKNITKCEFISDDNLCLNKCDPPYYKDYSNNIKKCSLKCPNKFCYNKANNTCVSFCDSGFQFNNYCIDSTESKNCFTDITKKSNKKKKCLASCSELLAKPCYKTNTKICIACNSYGNHIEGEFELFESCLKAGLNEGSYYLKPNDNTCYCYLYAIENNKKVCYKNEKACSDKTIYKFRKGNECLETCSPYFEVEDDVSAGVQYLKKCFISVDECKSNNYYYYNVDMHKCWNICPKEMYSNEVDKEGKPQEDNSNSTCVMNCGKDFPKHTKGMHICKKECDSNEFYILNDPNTCISSCNETYKYIGENHECLKTCDFNKYILKVNVVINGVSKTLYRCVSNCASYGKYYIINNQECYDDCLNAGSNYHFYNSDHRCLTSCLYDPNEQFSYKFINKPQRCRKTNEDKYYYEEDKIITDTKCELFSSDNPLKCVYNCDGRKVLPNNTCTSNCPPEYPYYNYEKLKSTSNMYVNRCVQNCPKHIIIYSNKCIDKCPMGFSDNGTICYPNCTKLQKFDIDDGKCKYGCPQNKYYEKTSYYGFPSIYICRSSCIGENKFVKDTEDHECVKICPKKNNYIQNNYECKPSCSNTEYYIKDDDLSTSDYSIYQCLSFCPLEKGYKYVIYNNEPKKECLKKCPENLKFIIEGNLNECLSACPSNYFYNIAEKNNEYITCKKYNFCTGTKKYYFNGTCYDNSINGCYSLNKHFVENNLCVDECKNNKYKKKMNQYTYECVDKCGENENEYIDSGDYCVSECPKGKNFIGKDKYCKSQCDTDDGEYYYKFKDITTGDKYTIYKCSKTCSDKTYYLEGYNTKQCFSVCPTHLPFKSINENMCYHNCLSSSVYQFTFDSNCVFSCNITKQYYYERNKICISGCNNQDYAYKITNNNYIYKCIDNCNLLTGYYYYYNESSSNQKNLCVKQCPPDRPYAEDNTCVKICSSKKKFFVKEFKHSEDNLQKICLTDCPKDYPYYTIYKDNKKNKYYECLNTCDKGYKVIIYSDPKMNATLCIKECPDSSDPEYNDYKFKIIDKNSKTCYSICPPEKPYHKLNYQDDNNCYENCPEETQFHEKNEFECKKLEDCEGKFIDYETKECLPKNLEECPIYRRYKSKFGEKYICLDHCIEKFGKYLSPNGTCVKDCVNDELVVGFGLMNDPKNDKCICKNLYIINDALKVECLQNTESETKCKKVSSIYSIKMFNSKECVKTCINENILSPTEDICYDKLHNCGFDDLPDDKNTKKITLKNGQKKCECKSKFYYKEDEAYPGFQKKICLDEDGLCPSEYGKFIPETKECIKTNDPCPAKFSCLFLDKFCLRDIPKNSTNTPSKGKYYECVKPNEYWHETKPDSGNYECIDKCLDKYPVYAPSTNQCLTKCSGSIYPYFYENKCYNSCNNSELLNIENGFVTYSQSEYANYVCDCHNPWFYNDVHKKICAESKIEYSIFDCNNFTNPNPNPVLDHLVRRTLQCVDKCPKEFNYTFNLECFENCTEAAYYYHYVIEKENSYECICENLWFYEPNNKKQCIDPNVTECVVYDYEDKFFDKKYYDKKYLINETKECVKECPEALYLFNYICYDKCPIYSNDNQNDHICKCNKYVGYWYEYERYNLTFLECAVENCPQNNDNSTYIRENLLQKENKCIITCREDEDFPFSLRKVCVKECPYFTHTNDKEGELNDTCLFYDLSDKDVNTLEKFKAATSVQVMELYKNSEKTGGYLYDKFNTTLQIYSVDRNDSLKDISFKSNLTYIDFGTCLDKLMIDKNISENESILITKYDILPDANKKNIQQGISQNFKDDKYLINPVEYELYSSLTNEKLDAFVCEPYEILISYPLCLSKFDKYINGINQNEYRKRFDIGKELYHKDNEIDTFNYNNTIYTHFCKELEINGKDLVFEDRYKYLYPNNKLLCESNCTMNNTDFELERVNCFCTYKDVFDFNRTEEEINDILNNPDFYLPTQSSTNAEIIKCLFNFTLKQAIVKNEMFYCCTIMTLAQITLVFITSIINIKDMINDIRHILNKVNIKNYFLKKNKVKVNRFKSDNMISSTNRELNNPPKKNNDKEDNDFENKDNEKIDHDFNKTILEKDLDNNNSKENKIDNENILDKEKIYSSSNNKAEYIPPDYNFKYFKPKDKGVIKKIERSEIPFDISPDTNYLIERREGIDYAEDYLNGPYLKNQNLLVVVNEKINIENKNKNKSKKSNNNILSLNNFNDNVNLKNANLKDDKIENKSKLRNSKLYDNLYNEKNFVTVKPIKSNLKPIINEKLDFNPETELKLNDEGTGFFASIRREQLFLRGNYDKYLENKNTNIYIVFLAEIFDKIYFIKICLFLKKFDIFNVQLSLYIFYHILLISLLCGFFTIKIIKKIWENDNFPDLNFYLLYGLIANIIIWIIYQMFICLLDFNGKIKDMITLKYELIENQYTEDFDRDNIHNSNEGIYKEKYDELIYQIKCRISIFYVLVFIFSLFFSIYLISFFSFYTGTKHRVLEAYYISIIEILLIKICYGLILASLRLISKAKRIKTIYNFVYFFDKHIS